MPPVWGPYEFTTLDIEFDLEAAPGRPGINPFSARGLKGTLSPIGAAQGLDKLRRTVNGTLISVAAPQMWKYRLEVSGEDHAAPALDGLFVGMAVTVSSHVELGFKTIGASPIGHPSRTAVPGSLRFEGDFSYYRPQMLMLIVDYQIGHDEWAASYNWSLSLEEV